MIWLGFGKTITKKYKDCVREVSEYSLHIQCSFRAIKGKVILLATNDIYESTQSIDDNFDWDTFDWDIQGNNLYDVKKSSYLKNLRTVL